MASAWSSRAVKEVIVYASRSHNIWANLAFEDWIIQNVDLSFRRVLFLWKNLPCVVIGRHQNPWLECNVLLLRQNGVKLARRKSGGGTVYHDLGNLNMTVFTHRSDYNRPRNLRLVTSALNNHWSTQLSVNQHHDIICKDMWKVSGSSSKLTKSSAYHHLTLLLYANTSNLQQYLTPPTELNMTESIATQSRYSAVTNLRSHYPALTIETVCAAIADEFYHVHGITQSEKIVTVDPNSEVTLPGITQLTEALETWDWNYGRTPKFTCAVHNRFNFGELDADIEVCSGRIERCYFETEQDIFLHQLQQSLIGCQLGRGDIHKQLPDHFRTHPISRDIVNWLDTIL